MSTELQLLRGSIKTNISATTNVYDVAGQWLPPGNYYFLINYTSTDCVKGELNCRGFKAEYTFASKDIIRMMACAQARLARRANIRDDDMPTYDSPITSPTANYPSNLVSHGYGNAQPPHTSPTMRTHRRRLPSINTQPTCMICLEILGDNPKTLTCQHKFHESCITRWCTTRQTCPICRRRVSLDRGTVVNRRISRYAVINRHLRTYERQAGVRTQNRRARVMPRRRYRNQQSLPSLIS